MKPVAGILVLLVAAWTATLSMAESNTRAMADKSGAGLAIGTQTDLTGPQGDVRRSGFEFMSVSTQALQRDDLANPGMLSVKGGELAWSQSPLPGARTCADCHGPAAQAMAGVAARYPAWDEPSSQTVSLSDRINLCRTRHQRVLPLSQESMALLSLTSFVANRSRGVAIRPDPDPRLVADREAGAQLYHRRMGQLDLSCAHCHDERWGQRLGGALIPQALPTGYPLYRLEWQALGSLQRRMRNCLNGVRAEPYAPDAREYRQLELYLHARAAGMPLETPAVRP